VAYQTDPTTHSLYGPDGDLPAGADLLGLRPNSRYFGNSGLQWVLKPTGADYSGRAWVAGAGFGVPGQSAGDLVWFDGAVWARVPQGRPGQLLQSPGDGTIPSWSYGNLVADRLVYLDQINGNDANPGTLALPVKTFGFAWELATLPYTNTSFLRVIGNLDMGANRRVATPAGLQGANPPVIESATAAVDSGLGVLVPTGGTAGTGGTANPVFATITTGLVMVANVYRGWRVRFTAGALSGVRVPIVSNDAAGVIAIAAFLGSAPIAATTFVIERPGSTLSYTGGLYFQGAGGRAVGIRGFDLAHGSFMYALAGANVVFGWARHLGAFPTLLTFQGGSLSFGGFAWFGYFDVAAVPGDGTSAFTGCGNAFLPDAAGYTTLNVSAGCTVSVGNSMSLSARINGSGPAAVLSIDSCSILSGAASTRIDVYQTSLTFSQSQLSGASVLSGAIKLGTNSRATLRGAFIQGGNIGVQVWDNSSLSLDGGYGVAAGAGHGVDLGYGSTMQVNNPAANTLAAATGAINLGGGGTKTWADAAAVLTDVLAVTPQLVMSRPGTA
jgi:hypothetical protein